MPSRVWGELEFNRTPDGLAWLSLPHWIPAGVVSAVWLAAMLRWKRKMIAATADL